LVYIQSCQLEKDEISEPRPSTSFEDDELGPLVVDEDRVSPEEEPIQEYNPKSDLPATAVATNSSIGLGPETNATALLLWPCQEVNSVQTNSSLL
jgi:hypothetical protein